MMPSYRPASPEASDRAAMRVQLERVPRSGRAPFDAAVRAADMLVAQAGGLARQLVVLGRAAVEREPDLIKQAVHDANTCLETAG